MLRGMEHRSFPTLTASSARLKLFNANDRIETEHRGIPLRMSWWARLLAPEVPLPRITAQEDAELGVQRIAYPRSVR
ncbi:hypothetical protein LMG24076_05376 [Trinickia soli]|nr:hypothetical protein LMG24076_05376 [Trinickia soli]